MIINAGHVLQLGELRDKRYDKRIDVGVDVLRLVVILGAAVAFAAHAMGAAGNPILWVPATFLFMAAAWVCPRIVRNVAAVRGLSKAIELQREDVIL